MTSQQLYDIIKESYPQSEVASVCYTNKDCLREGFCIDKQTHNVIDFDSVKDMRYRGKAPTPSSVDAVCVSTGETQTFCFVELKGWRRYIYNLKHQKYSPERTAEDYNLAGKLSDSQRICIELTEDSDLFAEMSVFFLLVTDIEVETRGIDALHTMLNQLGQTSTYWYSECLRQAHKSLDATIYINKAYITCREFDRFLNF